MDNLQRLLLDAKESLEREIHQGFDQVNTKIDQLNSRFDTQAARLDRHAGYWQAGTRWSSRMDVWAEKVDGALETKDREIAELRERLLKIERGLS
jgi:hypothetical protein